VRSSLENPFAYSESNVLGTTNLLEIAKQHSVNTVVIASSSSVYGKNTKVPFSEDDPVDMPISLYAATKRATELIAHVYTHLFGMNITCLRFFTVYGPYGRPDMSLFKFVKAIHADEPIDVYHNGDMQRDFTYVSDIVAGFIAALKKPQGFQIFNLGHGAPVQLMEFIKVIEKELGKKAKMNMLPMQPGDVPVTFADTTKAKQVLGFEAKVDVEEGVKKFVEWYRTYYNVA
jgi:UDP-glucuronate 4-epimerase